MLKLSPQSARGLHKLSEDIRNYQHREINGEQYQVRFSFIDIIKISAYGVLLFAVFNSVSTILGW